MPLSSNSAQVVTLLADPELPVRVDSVVSLRHVIDAAEDVEQLKPVLPMLLNSIFHLMNEVSTANADICRNVSRCCPCWVPVAIAEWLMWPCPLLIAPRTPMRAMLYVMNPMS